MAGMISQANENIELHIHAMERLIDFVSSLSAVRAFFDSPAVPAASAAEIKETIASIMAANPDIAGMLIVARDGRGLGQGFIQTSRDPLTQERWYEEAVSTPASIRLIPRPIGRTIRSTRSLGADEVVAIAKAAPLAEDGGVHGAVLIDLKLSSIENLFHGVTIGRGGFLYIADSSGEMVWAPVNRVAYRIPLESIESESEATIFEIENSSYQVLAKRSSYTKWLTLGVFSLSETLREVLQIRTLTYAIGGATMLLAIIVALVFSSSVALPILDLRTLMKSVEGGDLSVRYRGGAHDEIGELGLGFNEMIERIQSLIDQVYREQKSKREAELRILQEQIKPHFLYNTLDTIQWMAQEHRDEEVVRIVTALSSLFRIGLNRGREYVSLSEELEHVKSYLCIQKMRYEDKFDYSIHTEEGLENKKVLRVILQPLIENAIYHGIKERRGHGELRVEARSEGGDLLLSVRDDGVGMDEKSLHALEASLEDGGSSGKGYGLRNVHERLLRSFGPPYGVRLESRPGEGTTAYLRHPLRDQEE